jgi:alkanesulfonate monooxygenase SsuD/methylene tetrahydromethanopterin reductase-like flavin-dependent oxidoreductase (luciferase family)
VADGYIRSRSDLEDSKRSLTWAEEGARESGRDPSTLGFALLKNAFVWEDGDAWEVVRDGVAHQLGVYPAWYQGADTPGRPFEVDPPPEEALRATTAVGDRHEVIKELSPIVDAFAGRDEFHFVVRLHYPGMDLETAARSVELFGAEVLPALKGS